jgi:hypothetical protein
MSLHPILTDVMNDLSRLQQPARDRRRRAGCARAAANFESLIRHR